MLQPECVEIKKLDCVNQQQKKHHLYKNLNYHDVRKVLVEIRQLVIVNRYK